MPLSTYTKLQYRKLKNPIKDEGPWILEDHPTGNFYDNRRREILGGCLHITDGIDDYDGEDKSAEATSVNWGIHKDCKASWQVCVDSDSIVPGLPDWYTSWCQGVKGYNFNSPILGMEIGKKTYDWDKTPSDWVEKTVRNAAVWWAPRVLQYGIPLVTNFDRDDIQGKIDADEPFGFTSHAALDPIRRKDPGGPVGKDTFPWEMFFEYVEEEMARYTGDLPEHEYGSRLLVRDSVGTDVVELQTRLSGLGYTLGKSGVDGFFGLATEKAVKALQSDAQVEVDGRVGNDTYGALSTLSEPSEPTSDKTTPEEITVTRFAGANSYETSVLLSQAQYPDGADKVYLAANDDEMMGLLPNDGPVLLVKRRGSGLFQYVADEIKRLKPKEIIVLGGVAAVSHAAEQAAKAVASGE